MRKERIYRWLLPWVFVPLLLSCGGNGLPDPRIVNGTATLSGTLTYDTAGSEEPISLSFTTYNMISGLRIEIEIPVSEDGRFSVDIPVETDVSIGVLFLDIGPTHKTIMVPLNTAEPTIINICYTKEGTFDLQMVSNSPFGSYDMTEVWPLYKTITQMGMPEEDLILHELTPEQFAAYVDRMVDYKIDRVILSDTNLSANAKEFFARDIRLMFYSSFYVFDYQDFVVESYQRETPSELWDSFVPPAVELSYYSFLKDLDLNNPQNLYALNGWHPLLDRVLANEDIALPKIGDTPVDVWIKDAAKTLDSLTGITKGLFYDMLAVRSYVRQFEDQTKPLSEQQKQNITKYFKNKAIPEILFRENETIERLASSNSVFAINDTPDVPNEKLLDAIAAKYEGRAVVIDFWATWCGPCWQAIRELREVKSHYEQQGVVFVYVTNISSPEKLWRTKIEGIGGEHYYLTGEQWDTVMDNIETTSIPTYLLYDADGNLLETIKGYGGVEYMREQFERLIK